jgi:hypothetical protein
MYFIYSVVHRSNLFPTGIPAKIAGHAIMFTSGNSCFIKYFARFMWSSVVIITKRFNLFCVAISFIANAF